MEAYRCHQIVRRYRRAIKLRGGRTRDGRKVLVYCGPELKAIVIARDEGLRPKFQDVKQV